MLYIISKFEDVRSQWVYRYTHVIKRVLVSRHIDFMEINNPEEAIALCKNKSDAIYIPNVLSSSVLSIIKKCNEEKINVIMPEAFSNLAEPLRYSSISGDIFGVLKRILDAFRRAGKSRVALCGTNPYSQHDVILTDTFISLSAKPKSVFFNTATSSDSVENFIKDNNVYDAVICANDYAALALIKRLEKDKPEYLKNLSIISFSNSILARICKTTITSCQIDAVQIGNSVADIYQFITKRNNEYYSTITVHVPYQIYERETTKGISFSNEDFVFDDNDNILFQKYAENNYLSTSESSFYWKIDWALNQLTEKNYLILIELLRGSSKKKICENLYLSTDTVSYHLRKLRSIFQVENTQQLIDMLMPLVSLENIEKNIKFDEIV